MLKRFLKGALERSRALGREQVHLVRRLTGTASYHYYYTFDFLSSSTLHSWTQLFGALSDRPVHFLEIGSYEGQSTVWFLENVLRHPESTITCLDIFSEPRYERHFDHNIRVSQCAAKVRKHKGRSADHLLELAGQRFDVIYIDGSHAAADVLLDAALSWPLLAPDGILLFDDYGWKLEKPATQRPQLAIDLFLQSMHGKFELLHQNYQVAVRKLG
jgi:predicted O-methyltransferase YrrM